jgi:hypothetical protein
MSISVMAKVHLGIILSTARRKSRLGHLGRNTNPQFDPNQPISKTNRSVPILSVDETYSGVSLSVK